MALLKCNECGKEISDKATTCPNCGCPITTEKEEVIKDFNEENSKTQVIKEKKKKEKVKKPFYKKGWFIILVIIILFSAISSIKNNKVEEINWNSDIELSNMLPEPKSKKADISINSDSYMSVYIHKTTKEDYKEYLSECENKGYNLEADKSTTYYYAYNSEGYKLSLSYDENNSKMNISLDAPMEMNNIQWPTSELAQLLPIPKSTVGNISTDTSNRLYVYIGNTSLEDYNTYVNECSQKGFSVDYDKGEKYYNAKDSNGNKLSLDYIGGNTMTIEISKVEEMTATDTTQPTATDTNNQKTPEKTTSEEPKETSTKLVNGMRPEFKEAMDSYEKFMTEYCDFMKKYADSNGNDLTLLADYAKYMSEYSKFVSDFEKWDSDESMNTAETAYYIDVQARVSKKLLEVSQ